jgi:hypothetical protein
MWKGDEMLRAMFFSTGMFVVLCGASLLLVDQLVLNLKSEKPSLTDTRFFSTVNANRQRVIDPPDWAAYCLMSLGSVTVLYAVALPRKKSHD